MCPYMSSYTPLKDDTLLECLYVSLYVSTKASHVSYMSMSVLICGLICVLICGLICPHTRTCSITTSSSAFLAWSSCQKSRNSATSALHMCSLSMECTTGRNSATSALHMCSLSMECALLLEAVVSMYMCVSCA